jgi:hypothetical protein
MAALSTTIRQQIWRGLMRYWSAQLEAVGVNKTALQAAVNAADDWIDTNSASYNSALPIAFRTNVTAAQKALLLSAVCLARFNVPVLRRMLGEID